MAGPWEKFQQQAQQAEAPTEGPWTKFASPTTGNAAGVPVAPQGQGTGQPSLDELITSAALGQGLDPNIFRKQLQTESNLNPMAVGPKTRFGQAKGIAQMLDSTAAELGVTDPFDVRQAIPAAAKYMRQLTDKYGGDTTKALAAYNWGMGNLDKYGLASAPKETREYLQKITGVEAKDLPSDTREAFAGLQYRRPLRGKVKEEVQQQGEALGRGYVRDIPVALGQLASLAVPDQTERNALGGQTFNELAQQGEEEFQARNPMQGGRVLGSLINPVGVGLAAMAPEAVLPGAIASRLGPTGQLIAGGAVQGAIGAGLQPVDTSGGQSVLGGKAQQLLAGVATGGILSALAGAGANVVGRGVGAARGETNLPARNQAFFERAQREGFPVTAGQINPENKVLQRVERMQEVSPFVGITGNRQATQDAAKEMARKAVEAEGQRMQNMTYSGLPKIRELAAGEGPRAREAQALLRQVEQAGDDERAVMQASGNLMWLNRKIKSDSLYNEVSALAGDEHVPASNTLKVIDDVIKEPNIARDNNYIKLLIGYKNALESFGPNAKVSTAQSADDIANALREFGYDDMANELAGEVAQAPNNTYAMMNRFRSTLESMAKDNTGNGVMDQSKISLGAISRAVQKDMDEFADATPGLSEASAKARAYYNDKVAPYSEKLIAKNLREEDPDKIWGAYIRRAATGRSPYAADAFISAIGEKGRQAVRYGILKNAYESALDDAGQFSSQKFREALKQTEYASYFKNKTHEVDGLMEFMGHLHRSDPERMAQYNALFAGNNVFNPLTAAGAVGAMGAAAVGAPVATGTAAALALGGGKLVKWLTTTTAGQKILFSANVLRKGGSSEKWGELVDKAMQQFSLTAGREAGNQLGQQNTR